MELAISGIQSSKLVVDGWLDDFIFITVHTRYGRKFVPFEKEMIEKKNSYLQ